MSEIQTNTAKKRKENFCHSDITKIVSHVQVNSFVLFSPLSSCVTNSEKKRIWAEITEKLNASSTVQRTVEEVRKKWQDLRSQVKKKLASIKRLSNKTGGGPPPPPLTDIEEQVASTIPECQVSGIEGGIESAFDTEIQSSSAEVPVGIPIDVVTDNRDTDEAEVMTPVTVTPQAPPVMEATGSVTDTNTKASQVCSAGPVKQGKRSNAQNKQTTDFSQVFVTLKKQKMDESLKYKSELLALERRKTEALERIAQSLAAIEARLQPEGPPSLSLSPIIKLF